MNYDREQLQELRSGFDLLGYVEQQYEVQRRGNEYAIHCPLHVDITPSNFISPEKGLWFCHSCHKGGDILDWLIKIEGLKFPAAVEKLQKLTGKTIKQTETASSFRFFKSLSNINNKESKIVQREILPISYYDRFKSLRGEPHEWLEEGIKPEMIEKYDIRIDDSANRIVYRVFDNDDNFIGIKGRTRFSQYKLLGIKKYQNYNRIGTTDYFQGMHENRQAILSIGEAIVFEGLKSVMKADGFGYPNSIAAETSVINDAQAKILIEMGVHDCVIAFDNDVPEEEIKQSVNKLKRWMNIWVIQDKNGLLGDKSEKLSPVDKGEGVWNTLYECRRKIV